MSISSPSDGKVIPPPNDDVESRRVGAANETSLAFIGGRRHSWMQSGSTLPPVVRTHATGIRKKKQPSKTLAKNIPLRTIIKDNMTPEQNQAQGLKVSGEAAEALNTSRYVNFEMFFLVFITTKWPPNTFFFFPLTGRRLTRFQPSNLTESCKPHCFRDIC